MQDFGWIPQHSEGLSINKAGQVGGICPALSFEERVSQEDILDRVSLTAACTRSLSGPVRAGASKNLGAFRLKLRLKPPSGALTFRSSRPGPSATCLSQVPGGEKWGRSFCTSPHASASR